MSANRYSSRTATLGWILVIVGALLLLNHWHPYPWERWYFTLNWITVLIILGVGLFIAGVFREDHGAVFPGTLLFLTGLMFYLKGRDVIYLPWWRLWPLFLMILGVSFISLCIFEPRRKNALLPGFILIGLAFFFLFFPWSWDELFYWTGKLWPVLLIVIGLGILWKSVRKTV